MVERPLSVIRSLEATYWRALGKQVRANNVMSGARVTFVEKLKRSYFGSNGPAAPHVSNGASAAGAGIVLRGSEGKPAASAVAAPIKTKALVPIPFYGVQPQTFRTNEVIFTCIVGDRHALQSVDAELRYEHVLYVDRDVAMQGWNQRPLLFWDASPKLITLFHKFQLCSLLPVGTRMLWLDSRVNVSADVARMIFSTLDESDLCLFRHYERDCVYDEILAVLDAQRSSSAQCEEYAHYLRILDFPRNRGLFETGAMAFKAGPEVSALFRRVFGLCYRYVARDQLALPVALAGSNVKVGVYDGGVTHLRNAPGVTVKSWKEVL